MSALCHFSSALRALWTGVLSTGNFGHLSASNVVYAVFKSKSEDAPGTNVSLALRVGVSDNFKLEVQVTARRPTHLPPVINIHGERRTNCYIRTMAAFASTGGL